ncbi:MAG: phage tail protein [Plesiomonas sp.]|uniref:phage tail protein n=1 Tax=Plesiomonas sp. TaxID=2486279 RepID=UPI003F2BD40D
MYWLDNSTGVTTPPTIPPVQSSVRRYFTEGGQGLSPSTPGGEWFNMVTDELLALLALANITPDKTDHSQIAKAIQAIAFSAYPVGAPIPWPMAVPPSGFLAMTGQSFSSATYPKLALAYPALVLPDMRSEFIRGWDNGRGIDSGRMILNSQLDSLQNITGSVANVFTSDPSGQNGALVYSGSGGDLLAAGTKTIQFRNLSFNASLVARTSSETRPRNIPFNYIVRAA